MSGAPKRRSGQLKLAWPVAFSRNSESPPDCLPPNLFNLSAPSPSQKKPVELQTCNLQPVTCDLRAQRQVMTLTHLLEGPAEMNTMSWRGLKKAKPALG